MSTEAKAQAANEAETNEVVEDATTHLKKVTVTAQRREESLQDVPIAISVIDAAALADSNYTAIADIQYLSPGVNFNSNFGGGFNIRGIGTQSLLMTAEQSVGLVIDGVVQGLPEVSFAGPSYQTMTDIERIEVLKGPQGTLFGKNSSAGIIQIITKNPQLNETTLEAAISYGTDNETNSSATLNVPLGQKAALRVNGVYQQRDGFVENRLTNQDIWSHERLGFRGKLLVEPTDSLSLLFTGEYRRLIDDANGAWTLRECGSGFLGFVPCDELAAFDIVAGPENMAGAWDGKNYTRQTNTSLSMEANWDTPIGTITSISAYRDLEQRIAVDTDATPTEVYSYNHNTSGGDQFTQELRLNGERNIFNYTLGAYYYHATPFQRGTNGGKLTFLPDESPFILSAVAIGPGAASGYAVDVQAETESTAIFGQLEAEVSPGLTLIAGGRYTSDDVEQTIRYFDLPFMCATAFAFGGDCHPSDTPPTPTTAATSADEFTYKLTAQYYVTPNINIYSSYARGYKGPLIAYPANRPQELVRPETSKSWEAGIKSTLLDGTLNLNVDVFKTTYDDFQGQQRVGTPPVYYYTTTNAGGLETKGIEADAQWQATPNLQFGASVSYIPTEFTEFAVQCYDQYTNPANPIGECNYIQPGLPADAPPQFNASGYPQIYSPEWTYTLSGDYSVPVGTQGTLDFHADWNYRSETYGVVADTNAINEGYGLLNGQISYMPNDQSWRIAVFGRNLLDEKFVAGIFRTPFDSGNYGTDPLSTLGYSNIPALDSNRTLGVKLNVFFGS
ncbi:TonB-dependent receptor [Hyphomonas johnsonii MHS-2]|uniref:TonB-dependent receptor n=1 Tax=Hyphomonas johnsonii MHS-2 TaxID=1280950 RepID=A0A059FN85_9PROT|nr:TonB-dependent receptor [Hyphomonas johnsonii MHS-2]